MAGIRRTAILPDKPALRHSGWDAGIQCRVSLTQRDPNSGLARHFSEDQHAPDLA
jgi:hypothetical protein